MSTRRDFVKVSTVGLIGLALPVRPGAQTTNVVFEFQGLIAFAIARSQADKGKLPNSTSHVTALLVRDGAHPNRRLIIPGDWLGQANHVEVNIDNCSIEVTTGIAGPVTLSQGARPTNKATGKLEECGAAGQWSDLTWVANLEKVCGEAEVEKSALAKPKAGSTVCSQMVMKSGTLRGGAPGRQPGVDYAKQVWKMDPQPKEPYQQCFTDTVQWDTGNATCTIRVIDASGKEVGNYPVSAKSAGQILVTNLPNPAAVNPSATRAVHFAHYYNILRVGVTPKAVPEMAYVCPSAQPLLTAGEERSLMFSEGLLIKTKLRPVALPAAGGAPNQAPQAAPAAAAAGATAASAAAFGGPLFCENAFVFETV